MENDPNQEFNPLEPLYPDDWSQKVLCFNRNTYLLPVAMQIVINRIQNFDVIRGASTVQFTLYIWINCQGAPVEIINRHLYQVDIRLQNGTTEHLTDSNSEIGINENIVSITYSGSKETSLMGNLRWYPFCLYIMDFQIEIMSYVDTINDKETFIRYNFHQNASFNEMLVIKEYKNDLTECYFVQNHSLIDFVAEHHKDYQNESERIIYYPKLRYDIALYQSPKMYLISVFLPILVITIINFACYFEKYDQIFRVIQAILLMIPQFLFYFFTKTIIPKTSQLTMNDLFLIVNILSTLLLFIQSLLLLNQTDSSSETQIYLAFKIIAGFILFLPLLIFSFKYLEYSCFKKPEYQERLEELPNKRFGEFKINDWFNDDLPHCANPSLVRILQDQKTTFN